MSDIKDISSVIWRGENAAFTCACGFNSPLDSDQHRQLAIDHLYECHVWSEATTVRAMMRRSIEKFKEGADHAEK